MASAPSRKVRRNGNCVCSKRGQGFVLKRFASEEDAVLYAKWLISDGPLIPNLPESRFTDYLDRWPYGWTKAMEVK